MKFRSSRKIKLTLSYLRLSCKLPGSSMVILCTFTGARRATIPGTAAHPTARMSTLTRCCRARITAASRRSNEGWNLGEVVTDNATVHLQYRDDRQPTGAQSPGRMAI